MTDPCRGEVACRYSHLAKLLGSWILMNLKSSTHYHRNGNDQSFVPLTLHPTSRRVFLTQIITTATTEYVTSHNHFDLLRLPIRGTNDIVHHQKCASHDSPFTHMIMVSVNCLQPSNLLAAYRLIRCNFCSTDNSIKIDHWGNNSDARWTSLDQDVISLARRFGGQAILY